MRVCDLPSALLTPLCCSLGTGLADLGCCLLPGVGLTDRGCLVGRGLGARGGGGRFNRDDMGTGGVRARPPSSGRLNVLNWKCEDLVNKLM